MDRVILQVPMSRELKEKAEAVSADYGFSSLQETIRILLKKLATKRLKFEIYEEEINLSPQAERRYRKMEKDFRKGRNVYSADSVDEFFNQLHKSK